MSWRDSLKIQPQMIKGKEKREEKVKICHMFFIIHYNFFIKNYCFDLICGKPHWLLEVRQVWADSLSEFMMHSLTGESIIGLQRYLGKP